MQSISGFYYVQAADAVLYECRAKGAFRNRNLSPVTGDRVRFEAQTAKGGFITGVETRKNLFVRPPVANIDVLVLEDIIDSGRTLSYLCEYLKLKGADSVRTCTLLDKPSRREVEFTPDYVGLEIPDEVVVGYGLDYAERYRTLPYVGILRQDVYDN